MLSDVSTVRLSRRPTHFIIFSSPSYLLSITLGLPSEVPLFSYLFILLVCRNLSSAEKSLLDFICSQLNFHDPYLVQCKVCVAIAIASTAAFVNRNIWICSGVTTYNSVIIVVQIVDNDVFRTALSETKKSGQTSQQAQL